MGVFYKVDNELRVKELRIANYEHVDKFFDITFYLYVRNGNFFFFKFIHREKINWCVIYMYKF